MSQDTAMLASVNRYIEHKRELGNVFRTESFLLRSFGAYADLHAPGEALTARLAIAWATAPGTDNRSYYAKRLDAVRAFARYLAIFQPATQIPPTGILGPAFSRSVPYIYSQVEIVALMRAALERRAKGCNTNPLRNATLIGLLACTGMRVGEALALNNADVDFSAKVITVRNSKKLPMRLVPIRTSTVHHLQEYQLVRDAYFGCGVPDSPFFLSTWSRRLSYASFLCAFDDIRESARVCRQGTGRKPRIHDLRHTFACNYLLHAYRTNIDIDSAVQNLSVYLGHATVSATYYYLTAIPALLEESVKRFTRHRPGGGVP
jgi:integrase